MPTLTEWWNNFWPKVEHGAAVLPTRFQILPANVDKNMGSAFKRDQHYFLVKVNRIFLQYDREFWTTYAPMALIVSEFQYGGDDLVVPFVVGPSMLENDQIKKLPPGFLFLDTKVAGVHPYKGSGLKLTVILYRVKRSNLAKVLLKVIENVTSALDFSQTLSSYLKIATVVVDLLGELFGLDADNQPIIGLRQEFESGDEFCPGYFVLIDSDKIDRNKLWVRENELYYGDPSNLEKFTGANYILYSIGQTTERDDYDKFSPIGKMWEDVKTEASNPKPDAWENAKVTMASLYTAMVTSPDLTEDHANQLNDELVARMRRMHERALQNVSHGETRGEPDQMEKTRRKALDILKL